MKSTAVIFGGVVILALVVLAFYIGISNTLARANQLCEAQWSQVENVYDSRATQIPQLVEIVRGSAIHEHGTLQDVIAARRMVANITVPQNIADDPAAQQRYLEAQQQLGATLQRLMVVTEQYPTLQANAQFAGLMHEVAGMENRARVARGRFIAAVQSYNTMLDTWPYSMGLFSAGRQHREYFRARDGAEDAPEIDFTDLGGQGPPSVAPSIPGPAAPVVATPISPSKGTP